MPFFVKAIFGFIYQCCCCYLGENELRIGAAAIQP